MKKYINKVFVGVLIFLSALMIFIGMIAGPFGYEDVSIGASLAGILFAMIVIGFGLTNWRKGRK